MAHSRQHDADRSPTKNFSRAAKQRIRRGTSRTQRITAFNLKNDALLRVPNDGLSLTRCDIYVACKELVSIIRHSNRQDANLLETLGERRHKRSRHVLENYNCGVEISWKA
jgi:hypothetical protein